MPVRSMSSVRVQFSERLLFAASAHVFRPSAEETV